jgi:hypothetical protein
MEAKKLTEIAKLKIQNFNLSLQILQMQSNRIISERDRILSSEFKRLKCKPGEWLLNEQWELIKRPDKNITGAVG